MEFESKSDIAWNVAPRPLDNSVREASCARDFLYPGQGTDRALVAGSWNLDSMPCDAHMAAVLEQRAVSVEVAPEGMDSRILREALVIVRPWIRAHSTDEAEAIRTESAIVHAIDEGMHSRAANMILPVGAGFAIHEQTDRLVVVTLRLPGRQIEFGAQARSVSNAVVAALFRALGHRAQTARSARTG